MTLTPLRSELIRHTRRLLVLAAGTSGILLVVFGGYSEPWHKVALFTLAGVVLFGGVELGVSLRRSLPRGRLRSPPADAVVVTDRDSKWWPGKLMLVFLGGGCLFLAWLVDTWEMSAAFVPGQFLGYATANALGAVVVARWERRNGKQVVVNDDDEEETQVYAV